MSKKVEKLEIPVEYCEIAKRLFKEKTSTKAIIKSVQFANNNIATSVHIDKNLVNVIKTNLETVLLPKVDNMIEETESMNAITHSILELIEEIAKRDAKEL